MAKLKPPTPQELYKARKQREEQEKEAYLPPGLINHGNTCFMNSVLQGLIATRLLRDLVYFTPIPPSVQRHSTTPIASRRSPQLTNGHGLGGEYEKPWENTMPLGDILLIVMHRGWELQRLRRRSSLTPKECPNHWKPFRPILGTLGRKFDQYLDFAQQDAHEFLRQLLDATRMEEFDVIKQRQPPPPPKKHKKGPRTTIAPSSFQSIQPALSPGAEVTDPISPPTVPVRDEEKLMTLADMIFGGKLTSILVCQKCKHVSQTYEDFNDLSLSIKPDDFARERKRDRLKTLAKRLTSFPTPTLGMGLEMQRSSSVPPSPRERESDQRYEPPLDDAPRRRSLDIVADQDANSEHSASKEDTTSGASESEGSHTRPVSYDKHIELVTPQVETPEKKRKKDKDDEGWVKLSKRISMTVGIRRGSKERVGRSRDSRSDISTDAVTPEATTQNVEAGTSSEKAEVIVTMSTVRADIGPRKDSTPEIRLSRPSLSPEREDFEPNPRRHSLSPALVPAQSSKSLPRFPNIQRATSPKPPRPSAAETEYLRHILADVAPSSLNPFALFKPTNYQSANGVPPLGSPANAAQSAWLKMSQFPGVDECLRMFTAVEHLDGENMVGCRQCWKIANGVNTAPECADGDSDSAEHEAHPTVGEQGLGDSSFSSVRNQPSSEQASIPTSMSTPIISLYSQTNTSDGISVSSLPTTASSAPEPPILKDIVLPQDPNHVLINPIGSPEPPVATPGGVPIPLISTTGPESPVVRAPLPTRHAIFSINPNDLEGAVGSVGPQDPTPDPSIPSKPVTMTNTDPPPPASTLNLVQQPNLIHPHLPLSHPTDSLLTPQVRHKRQKSDLDTTDESSGGESDTSVTNSGRSSASLAPNTASSGGDPQIPQSAPAKQKSRPKPVIMRPAYKRYLIATPPPVLVIHLKRFRQISKTPTLSFSNGFKKLDDYVTFPEYLDLTPFLAPKREDFGLGKKGKVRSKVPSKTAERCMYRLYAVVVHIGNMLGGHYIAYTALPNPDILRSTHASPQESASTTATPETKSASQATAPKPERQWAYISDTIVRLTTLEEVLKAKAYICMYERI